MKRRWQDRNCGLLQTTSKLTHMRCPLVRQPPKMRDPAEHEPRKNIIAVHMDKPGKCQSPCEGSSRFTSFMQPAEVSSSLHPMQAHSVDPFLKCFPWSDHKKLFQCSSESLRLQTTAYPSSPPRHHGIHHMPQQHENPCCCKSQGQVPSSRPRIPMHQTTCCTQLSHASQAPQRPH